jgi:hypothetical protein
MNKRQKIKTILSAYPNYHLYYAMNPVSVDFLIIMKGLSRLYTKFQVDTRFQRLYKAILLSSHDLYVEEHPEWIETDVYQSVREITNEL